MAFYNEEEDEQGEVAGTGITVGPEAGTVGAVGSGGAAPAGGLPGNFVGISDYINANKTQSEKLADQVAGKVDEKAQMADKSLEEAQTSFNQKAEAQKVNVDEDLLGQVQSNAESVVSDPNKVTSFNQIRNAQYAGPKALEETEQWGGLQSALQQARGAKEAAGTEQGRMGLIKEVSNNPRQSQGALTFDNLLLQSNPNAAQKLQAAGSNLGSFDQRLEGAKQTAAQKAAEIQGLNTAAAQRARDAVKQGFTGLGEQLSQREAQADAAEAARVQAIQEGIRTGKVTPDILQALNMSAQDKTYGVDLSQFLQYQDRIDKNSVATQEDLARQAALRALAGGDDLGQDFINSAALGQRGQSFDIDLPAYLAAQDQVKNRFNAAFTDKASTEWDRTNQQGSDIGSSLDDIIRILGPIQNQSPVYKARYEDALVQKAALQNKYNFNKTLGGA